MVDWSQTMEQRFLKWLTIGGLLSDNEAEFLLKWLTIGGFLEAAFPQVANHWWIALGQ